MHQQDFSILRRIFESLLVASVLLVAGCAGPKFSPTAGAPPDKALVYVYRKSSLSGALGNHHIFANGKPITSLHNGNYYPYLAQPGTNYLSSKQYSLAVILDMTSNIAFKNRICQINVEAGKTYYVQFEIATTWGPRLTEVGADKGAKDILDCHLAKPLN